MNTQDLLNHYPGSYTPSNDGKTSDRDRNYDYMDRLNDLGTSVLDQPISMGLSGTGEYRYSSGPAQPNQLCTTANPQALLTPPQATDDATHSMTNASPTAFAYSGLPRVSTSAPHNLDYYSTTNAAYLPSSSGDSHPQTERLPGSLHMTPLSPPYAVQPSYSIAVNRQNMPSYSQMPPQRPMSFNESFRIPPASSLLPFAANHHSWPPSLVQQVPIPPPRSDGPPFDAVKTILLLHDVTGRPIPYDIFASIPKGFFYVAGNWTCYRRNYFTVSCGFNFVDNHPDGQVYLSRYTNRPHQIGSLEHVTEFAVSISAKTAAANSTESEIRGLTQHTPKRDKATEKPPSRQVVGPAPVAGLGHSHGVVQNGIYPSSHMGPFTSNAIDNYGPAATQGPPSQYTFERIQFVKATANNGKRRAQQQFFHVVVSLEANVGRPGGPDEWVTVSTKSSSPMVVRGRSPGHYKDGRRNDRSSMDPEHGTGHHHDLGHPTGYTMNPPGNGIASTYGTHLGSYRMSNNYNGNYNHAAPAKDDSSSPSSTPSTLSPAVPGSPSKDDLRRGAQRISIEQHIPNRFDRMRLSSCVHGSDLSSLGHPLAKKRTYEEATSGNYYSSSGVQNNWRNEPAFDFSATSTGSYGTSA